ncbi:SMI1/KNR4 family protein [Actinocorallia aurantiaca]|uniref:Knr4/Smi1-like domain-containing protein n=1 Tax=Actinocorallia aurantiaca TaxID=46204 RepID=A0ABN3UVU5_9ACTN
METTDPFHRAWSRFATWLAEHSPHDHSELRPPATDDQISAIETLYGFPLHPELKALLQLHDGARRELGSYDLDHFQAGSFLPLGHRLNDTDLILGMHEFLVETAAEWEEFREEYIEEPLECHADEWVPFAHPNDGGLAFVDHRPGPTYGHVFEWGAGSGCDPQPWATSLTDLFDRLADAIETGSPFRHHYPCVEHLGPGRWFLNWPIQT